MNPVILVRSALVAMATTLVWGGVSTALAADVTPPPAPVYGAPVTVGDPGCASCQSGQPALGRTKCNTCGKLFGSNLHKDRKAPYPVTLCPGACFGYFQTQWRKWDDVCPYPYLGQGVTDAPRPPAGVLNPLPPGGGTLTPPRPLDPKMTDPKMPDPKKTGSGSSLPPIPVVQSKFTTPG